MPIGSYVEVSSGGDQDILSFYSTTASSTWKDPCRALSHKPIKEIETGYSKNSVARYQISSERRPKLTTTYRHAVHENLSRIMSADLNPKPISSETSFDGGYPTSARQSPIKWREDPSQQWYPPSTSKSVLDKKLKHDPIERENDGMGPADFSTTFRAAWTDPRRARRPAASDLPAGASTRRDSARSGWKENNALRDHPWAIPGPPDDDSPSTTYAAFARPPRRALTDGPLEMPAPGGRHVPITARAESGFARHARNVILGPGSGPDDDPLSTTHRAYIAGRRPRPPAPPAPLAVPPPRPGEALAESGFCRAYNTDPSLVIPQPPPSPDAGRAGPGRFGTTAAADFAHPAARAAAAGSRALRAAGGPSGYARAVAPVDALTAPSSPPPEWLHPAVAAARARRDPAFFRASPERERAPPAEALGSPGSPGGESDTGGPRSPAGLPSGRLSVLATVLRA